MKAPERPSEDVLRLVHAFPDAGRKQAVRELFARVASEEAERDNLYVLLVELFAAARHAAPVELRERIQAALDHT